MRPTLLCLALLAPLAASAEGLDSHGELRATATLPQAAETGPLAAANRLQAGTAAPPAAQGALELEWQARWQGLSAELWLGQTALPGGRSRGEGRFNELLLSGETGDWSWSAGKKRVGWDVGYAFRPNDVVAREARRTLLAVASEGRPVLQLEHFAGADQAVSLVWANPQNAGGGRDALGADESALAARGYQRLGALDAYAFGRWGRHTGASAGAALAWVAGDELELHASWRLAQRHDGSQVDPAAGLLPQRANPWHVATQGTARQWLLGLNWTGGARQSLLLEAWHDGEAPSNAQWRAWGQRNAALLQRAESPVLPAPLRAALAGNLAWQASPFGGSGLRQDNLFVRAAWQPDPWTLSLDGLATPADHGLLLTANLQWQGDRWRLAAAWRQSAGTATSLFAQLPQRRVAVLSAACSF